MAVTFDDIITRTGYYLDEAGLIGGSAGDCQSFATASAEVKVFVNWGYAEVLRILPQSGNRIGVKTDNSIDWVADTELYTLPADCQWVMRVEGGWDETDESKRYTIPVLDNPEERFGYYATSLSTDARPVCYFEITTTASRIGFIPIPSAGKTNNIKIWYWPAGASLLTATGSAILPFLEEYNELICMVAARKILGKTGRDLTQTQFLNYNQLKSDLETNIRDFQQQSPPVAEIYDDYGN